MARARNIKPSFFTHDALADNDPLGRLLFIGLWTIADYKGELEWRPKRVKAQIMPYDECNIEELAINLEKTGFIRFYSVSGSDYVHIVNFNKHQNPHKNEKDKGSDVPAMTRENIAEQSQTIDLDGVDKITNVIEINREENGSAPADSLFLIPDSCSLIPDSVNLIPSVKDPMSKPSVIDDRVKQVIDLLNDLTGAKYKASTKSHAENIRGRLDDGHSVEDLKMVVRHKCSEWLNDKSMSQYLRPSTLFQAGKFNGYLIASRAAGFGQQQTRTPRAFGE